jgi:drug/metabolite transporter (DMT)-like permease
VNSTHFVKITLAVAGSILWSLDGLLVRIVHANAGQILFWRMASLTFILGLVLFVSALRSFVSSFSLMKAVGWWIALLLVGVNALFLMSITRTAVANTYVIFAVTPIVGAVLGARFLKERLPFRTKVAILIASGGVMAICGADISNKFVAGDFYALATSVLFAGTLTTIRSHADVPLLPPLVLSGAGASIFAAVISAPLEVGDRDIAILIVSGALQQTLGLIFVLYSAKFLPPVEIGLLAMLEVVLGPLWVWLALGDGPSPTVLVVGVLLIATLMWHSWLATRQHR